MLFLLLVAGKCQQETALGSYRISHSSKIFLERFIEKNTYYFLCQKFREHQYRIQTPAEPPCRVQTPAEHQYRIQHHPDHKISILAWGDNKILLYFSWGKMKVVPMDCPNCQSRCVVEMIVRDPPPSSWIYADNDRRPYRLWHCERCGWEKKIRP